MCGIVTQNEQPRHHQASEEPQRHQQQRVVGHHDTPYCDAVDNQIASNEAYPSDQRSLLAVFGDDFQDRLETSGFWWHLTRQHR